MTNFKSKLATVLYYFKNFFFIFMLVAAIILVVPTRQVGILGLIFQITLLIYCGLEIYFIIIKDEEILKNITRNILSLFLADYFLLLGYRYLTTLNSGIIVQENYYLINVAIIEASLIIVILDSIFIRKSTKIESKD